MTFIDFAKAFDSVNREVMWLTLQEYGIARKIVQIIKMLYDKFRCKISHEGKLSEFIEVRNGVRIFSPNPFSANIRQSDKKSKMLKEKRNTVEHERKIGRFGQRG